MSRRRALLIAVAMLIAPGTVRPVAQGERHPAVSLSGVVVIGGTKTPVPYALVELRADAVPGPNATSGQRVLTDSAGRWALRSDAGVGTIHVSAHGYLPGSFGQRSPGGPGLPIQIDSSKTLVGLTIQIWRHSVITGTVRDEYGEPLVNTPVRVLRRAAPGPRVRHVDAGGSWTNDLGQYRVAGLLPGDYVVAAATQTIHSTSESAAYLYARALSDRPGDVERTRVQVSASGIFNPMASAVSVGEGRLLTGTLGGFDLLPPPLKAGERARVLFRTYYPSASGPSTAEVMSLKSGDVRSAVDITVRYVPALRVRGVVIGPDGPEPLIGVQLLHASEDAYASSGASTGELPLLAAPTDGAGRFHFAAVPPGRYRLQVLRVPRNTMAQSAVDEPTLWASQPLHVGDSDIDDITVMLTRGWRVRGAIAAAQGAGRPPDFGKVGVSLSLADGRPLPSHLSARADQQGNFHTIEYPAGRYFVDVTGLPPGWVVQSALADDRDAFTRSIEIVDRDISGVVVTLTDQAGAAVGSVRTASGAVDDQATVALFPRDHAGWLQDGGHPRLTREVRADHQGVFRVTGLPAGQYLAATLDDAEISEWRTAQRLVILAKHAASVEIVQGRESTVSVTSGRR